MSTIQTEINITDGMSTNFQYMNNAMNIYHRVKIIEDANNYSTNEL